jgi:hypothetical protein
LPYLPRRCSNILSSLHDMHPALGGLTLPAMTEDGLTAPLHPGAA